MSWKEPKPRWFWFYAGPDMMSAVWGTVWLGVGGRRDLMTRPDDEGRYVLVVAEAGIRIGPTYETMNNGRLWPWVFRTWFRSDAGEIAERLAGGKDGAEATMRARAKAFMEKRSFSNDGMDG